VETKGFGGGGVVAAAFGDVQVAGVFDGRDDGGADGGQVDGPAAGAAGGGIFPESKVADVVVSHTSFMQTSDTYVIGWRARVHQQCDFVLLVTCHTNRVTPEHAGPLTGHSRTETRA